MRAMSMIVDMSPVRGAEHVTVVMLPGAGDNPEDLIEQGFVRTLRERHLAVDAVVVDAHMDYYLKSNIVEHLEHDVIAPLHADGHSHLWFMGISLGGMGAMAYAREHKPEIEGMI